jgi:hypothetical protein
LEGAGKIVAKSRIGGLRVMFCLQLSFINANELLSFSSLFAETIVCDPVEPRRKTCLSAEAAQILIGAQKRFLRQVVRECDISPDKLAEQTSHARLVISHQLRKGMVVVIEKNTRDEVCIG